MKITKLIAISGAAVLVIVAASLVLLLPLGTNPTSPTYPTPARVAPLSNTMNGYTVTLYPMYADANLIVFTYTVQSSYQDLSQMGACDPLVGQDPPCRGSGPFAAGSTPP